MDEAAALARFYDLSLDLLGTAGFDGYIRRVNPAGRRMLGWDEEALRARPYLEFVHAADRERVVAELVRLLGEPGYEVRDFELRFRRSDGAYRWLLFSVRASPEEELIYTAAKDITERKEAEEALEQFAYVASHDLSEPLRVIGGFAGLLDRRHRAGLDAEAGEFLDHIRAGVEGMEALISDLLAYSRLGGERRDAPVDMGAVAADAVATLGAAVSDSGATVWVGALPMVRGDERMLRQLLQNLVANAVKFRGSAPPVVRIDAAPEPEGGAVWRFHVTDNGIGIDPVQAARVFGIFQRLHSRDEYPGTGIGLAICQRVVERHGGRIWIEPASGGGTTVLFTLPGV